MEIDEAIFPEGCNFILKDGSLSLGGRLIMETIRLSEWNGQGTEHPCYGCRNDECTVRQVDYHDSSKQYLSLPVGATAIGPNKTIVPKIL